MKLVFRPYRRWISVDGGARRWDGGTIVDHWPRGFDAQRGPRKSDAGRFSQKNNPGWLFPTTWESDGTNVSGKLRILSMTYRSNESVAMFAPLRGYLCPKDPNLFPLVCPAKSSV